MTILIVEDTYLNQVIAAKIMEKHSIKFKVVDNGLEAFTELKKNSYSLVLMDCYMPVLDGYQTTALVRSCDHDLFQTLPIIAMTSNAMGDEKEKCLNIGMNDFISKPIHEHDLLALIGKWSVSPNKKDLQAVHAHTHIHKDLLRSFYSAYCNSSFAEFDKFKNIFIKESGNYLKILRTNADHDISREMKVALHSLASTGTLFGAIRLVELVRAVSQLEDRSHSTLRTQIIEFLQVEFAAIEQTLQAQDKRALESLQHVS